MALSPITGEHRYTPKHPCPICGGKDGDPRGQGKRCHGFSKDGWAYCAQTGGGRLVINNGLYRHRLTGTCYCGVAHGPETNVTPITEDMETWDYVDEHGSHLFQIVKTPKGKRVRRKLLGDWVWNAQGVPRVPYRYPELLASTGTVYIADGERDVETLRGLGLTATTNPFGAGNWGLVHELVVPIVRGRHVIIVADNDTAGSDRAQKLTQLLGGVASSVTVLAPPAPHKDVSDLLGSGGGLEDMAPLDGANAPARAIEYLSPDVLWQPQPARSWAIEALAIAHGAPTLLGGYGFSGKTITAQSIALAVASGRPLWGVFKTIRGKVLHLDYEQGQYVSVERYQRLREGLGIERGDIGDNLHLSVLPAFRLNDPDASDILCRALDGYALLVVDSLRASIPGEDENDSNVRTFLDILTVAGEKTGCVPLVIHHARKSSDDKSATMAIRGSSAIFDACQTAFVMGAAKGEPIKVSHEKDRLRGKPVDDFGLRIEDVEGIGGRTGLRVVHLEPEQVKAQIQDSKDARVSAEVKALVPKALALLRTARLSTAEIQRALCIGVPKATALVQHLSESNLIQLHEGARGTRTWAHV